MTDNADPAPRRVEVSERGSGARGILLEVVALYFATLLAIKGVILAQLAFGLPEWVLVAIPAMFIYVPVFYLERKRLDLEDYGLVLEGIGPALKLNGLLMLSILVPFVVGNHFYQTLLFDRHLMGVFPDRFWTDVLLYHLLFVAFPEEFFYRGYVQSRLNDVFSRRFRVLGVSFGWGLVLTAILFTIGHSLIVVRWWHFSIVFPALVFGLIRERTGNVVASSFFHAMCNVLMVTLDTWYGVIPP